MEVAVIWTICAIVGAIMSESRNRSKIGGFFLGLIFGVFGIAVIVLVGKKKEEKVEHKDYSKMISDIKD